MAAKFKRRK